MSLVGFKAKNHRQQTRKRGADDTVDDRITPQWLFDELNQKHGPFTVDVAASAANRKCSRFYDLTTNGLEQSWHGEHVWCNPPYSNIGIWVAKAMHEVFVNGCPRAVLLLPSNRTEQQWWQAQIEPVRDRGRGVSTDFLSRRINFGTPANPDGKYNSSSPFGLVVVTLECPKEEP